jgi:hypothetical protein
MDAVAKCFDRHKIFLDHVDKMKSRDLVCNCYLRRGRSGHPSTSPDVGAVSTSSPLGHVARSIDAVVQRLEVSQKHAAGGGYVGGSARDESPFCLDSVWSYGQGLTRLSQRTPWQDGPLALDRAASHLLTTVH